MTTIRCKSCGRVYNYEKNDTCPKCGAYNRPPRKEIVASDGSIHYVTTENKECYEEKECYEDEVRQRPDPYSYTLETPADDEEADEIDSAAKKLWHHRNAIATSGGKKSVVILGIISALCSLTGVVIGNFSSRHEVSVQEPWESVSVEPAAETRNLNAHMGSEIPTENGFVTIHSCQQQNDVLEINLRCDNIEDFDLLCYYETSDDSGYLDTEPAYSDGDLFTAFVDLPDGINRADCAVVLDVPLVVMDGGFTDIVHRYWIWLDSPTYGLDEDFFLCNQRLFVSKWRQSGTGADIYIDCEHDILSHCEATLTVLNVNEQPYTTYVESSQCQINYTDGRNTAILGFTLRNKNDTVQSITLLDHETQREITVHLQ